MKLRYELISHPGSAYPHPIMSVAKLSELGEHVKHYFHEDFGDWIVVDRLRELEMSSGDVRAVLKRCVA